MSIKGWKKHISPAYPYWVFDRGIRFLIEQFERRYCLSFNIERSFNTLREAKLWVEMFRKWDKETYWAPYYVEEFLKWAARDES